MKKMRKYIEFITVLFLLSTATATAAGFQYDESGVSTTYEDDLLMQDNPFIIDYPEDYAEDLPVEEIQLRSDGPPVNPDDPGWASLPAGGLFMALGFAGVYMLRMRMFGKKK